MKTQKIFLLVVVLLFALMPIACGNDEGTAPDYFAFDADTSFSVVHELDGEIVAANMDKGLVALATEKLNTSNEIERTIKVYDISDNNRVVFEQTSSYQQASSAQYASVELSQYPIIKLIRQQSNGTDDDGNVKYEERYDYYLIGENQSTTCIVNYTEDDDLRVEKVGNIYLIEAKNNLYWVSKDLKVMRTVPVDVSETYVSSFYFENYFELQAEWGSYLYTWEFDVESASEVVLVYDSNGVCCAKYTHTPGTVTTGGGSIIDPSVYVLNNGDVLIQECVIVEDGEDYDFEYSMGTTYKLDLVTKIMDHTNGTTIDVECDFLITELESAYAHLDDSDFPFALAGNGNQALTVSIADGSLARTTEYVILSDTLEVAYTLNNAYLALSSTHSTITDADNKGYTADAYVNGVLRTCRFDWDGNILFTQPTNYIDANDEYYITASGVYNMAGELVFDIENSEFASTDIEGARFVGKNIYLTKYNYETDGEELYLLNTSDGTTTMIADGVDSDIVEYGDDNEYPFVVIENELKGTLTVYDANGEIALILAADDIVDDNVIGNTLVFEIEVDGNHKTYLLGEAIKENEEDR